MHDVRTYVYHVVLAIGQAFIARPTKLASLMETNGDDRARGGSIFTTLLREDIAREIRDQSMYVDRIDKRRVPRRVATRNLTRER